MTKKSIPSKVQTAIKYKYTLFNCNAPNNRIVENIMPHNAGGVNHAKLLSAPNCIPENNPFKMIVVISKHNKSANLGAPLRMVNAMLVPAKIQANMVVAISIVAKLKVPVQRVEFGHLVASPPMASQAVCG